MQKKSKLSSQADHLRPIPYHDTKLCHVKDDTYNSYERDIAILHAYFGQQTMPGEEIVW